MKCEFCGFFDIDRDKTQEAIDKALEHLESRGAKKENVKKCLNKWRKQGVAGQVCEYCTPSMVYSFYYTSYREEFDEEATLNVLHDIDYAGRNCGIARMRRVFEDIYEDAIKGLDIQPVCVTGPPHYPDADSWSRERGLKP